MKATMPVEASRCSVADRSTVARSAALRRLNTGPAPFRSNELVIATPRAALGPGTSRASIINRSSGSAAITWIRQTGICEYRTVRACLDSSTRRSQSAAQLPTVIR